MRYRIFFFFITTMMAGNMPFPSFFLANAGELTIPFKTWRQLFENYLLLICATGNSWPDVRCRAVLLHCLGTEGQYLFYSLADGQTCDTAMMVLVNYFIPKTLLLNTMLITRGPRCRMRLFFCISLHYMSLHLDVPLVIIRTTWFMTSLWNIYLIIGYVRDSPWKRLYLRIWWTFG